MSGLLRVFRRVEVLVFGRLVKEQMNRTKDYQPEQEPERDPLDRFSEWSFFHGSTSPALVTRATTGGSRRNGTA